MVVSHRSIVAGAVLLVASASGASADYYRGMKDMPVATMQPASWYLRGDASYSWMNADELNGAISRFGSLSIDDNWALGGGVGYYFGRGIRGDVTYEYRFKSDVHGSVNCFGGDTVSTDFDLKSSLLLGNLYYDFRPYERFTPYVGVGVGAAHHRTSSGSYIHSTGGCGSTQTYQGDSNWSAAGAVMAGFSIRLDRGSHAPVSIKDGPVSEPGRLHLDVGYRFLYLGDTHAGNLDGVTPATPGPRLDDVTAQEIRVGLRWDLR